MAFTKSQNVPALHNDGSLDKKLCKGSASQRFANNCAPRRGQGGVVHGRLMILTIGGFYINFPKKTDRIIEYTRYKVARPWITYLDFKNKEIKYAPSMPMSKARFE